MIYANCIDACFDCVKAAERCAFEGTKDGKKKCPADMCCSVMCAEICALVGRLTARGHCTKDLYELCAKTCDKCVNECGKVDHEYACDCAAAAKKCAEACRKCMEDCDR
jgi:hypothetical protein